MITTTGLVTGLSLVSAGSGYTSAPTVVLSDPIAQATAVAQLDTLGTGTVSNVNLTSNGAGYLFPPTVTIEGDGTGATAIANINSSGNNYLDRCHQ